MVKLFESLTRRAIACIGVATMLTQPFLPAYASAQSVNNSARTTTKIKHVIVIIGENRTFDHIFATYEPREGESVDNLLSKRIIHEDGTPGVNFWKAHQSSAIDSDSDGYLVAPGSKAQYPTLPTPLTGGAPTAPYFSTVADAKANETDLPNSYYKYLTTGGTGLPKHSPDTRIPHVTTLPPGPFQITSLTLPYDSYTASPVHRFYQMRQQLDCSAQNSSKANPSGCVTDLFSWVEVTVGAGANGNPQPSGFTDASTGEGSTAMGFYNMHKGDAPYLKSLADRYAMSDNFHQSVMGGTGANHIMLGTGDAMYFSDGNGHPAVPPLNQLVAAGPNTGTVDEIENPNPQPGTNNFYTEDGYGGGGYGSLTSPSPSYGGGSYSNCSDQSQPGVGPILDYLNSLPYEVSSRCAPGRFYLLNNYDPGYYGNGTSEYADIGNPSEGGQTVFTIPPSSLPSIGDKLIQHQISWKYYGGQWNTYVADPLNNYVTPNNQYCNICNPFQYLTSIMTNDAVREAHLKDTTDLTQDIAKGTLPAVSFVKPDGWLDGHPASSKLNLFEGFVAKIVDEVKANEELWGSTAIFVTFDEGGGYYDSGYVQPLDFFGDGTRIPLLVVSPYTKPGHISHVYSDHVSILKFIEANWKLPPVSGRSRDNLPNPKVSKESPYVPLNQPAIGDLMDLFDFNQHHE
jgi:phospholipase C